MSRTKIAMMLLASLLLSGCSQPFSASHDSLSSEALPTSSSESGSSGTASSVLSSPSTGDGGYVNAKGSFEEKEGVYTACAYSSLLFFNESVNCGTFFASVFPSSDVGDNGVVFFADSSAFYFFGLGLGGKLNLFHYAEGVGERLLYSESLPTSQEYALAVYFDAADRYLEIYLNSCFLFSYGVSLDESLGESYGFYSGAKGTSYSGVTMKKSLNAFDNDGDNYVTKNGSFSSSDGGFVAKRSNSLLINEGKPLSKGSIEATIDLNNDDASDSGIVFGLSDDDAPTYWEGSGISYYFFFTSIVGLAYLGKTSNGTWTLFETKPITGFSNAGTYTLKAEFDGEFSLFYVNGQRYFTNIDSVPLLGRKWGFRAGKAGVRYSSVKAHDFDLKLVADNSLDVVSGSFESFEGQAISISENSFGIIKGSSLVNGTINVSFAPGNSMNGIAFRVTRPGGKATFYENEEGLSYYWLYYSSSMVGLNRYENGVVTKQKTKCLNAGVSASMIYDVRIVLDGDDIYVYMRGVLRFYLHDDAALTGGEYGIKASLPNCFLASSSVSESREHETDDVLVFGHSYMELWSTYKQDLAIYDDIADIGIGGSIASQWNETYDSEVVTYAPRLGIYGIGINDLSAGISPEKTVADVKALLLKIKAALPTFAVVLLGVSQCTARTSISAEIHETNLLYRNLCNAYDWMHFADCEYLFCDSNNNPIAGCFVDGLHPTHASYLELAKAIRAVAPSL